MTGRQQDSLVWRMLIAPLIAIGMRKPKVRSVEEQAAFLARLDKRLAYLEDGELETLVEVIQNSAGGEARNLWPDEVSILNWAHALRPAPDEESRLVTSYLGSAAGRRAWDEGPEVALALRGYLRRFGRPPVNDFDWSRIRGQADDTRRALGKFDRLEEHGTLSPQGIADRAAIQSAIAHVRELVFGREAAA